MERNIPVALNLALVAAMALLSGFAFFILPLFLLPRNPAWLWALLPFVLAANTHWFLTHESFHMNLHPTQKVNERLGRFLAVLFLAPYAVVRFGHLQHHRFNGALTDRPDLYDPARTSRARASFGYYFQLLGGFYLGEVAAYLPFALPARRIGALLRRALPEGDDASRQIKELAIAQFTRPDVIFACRIEAMAAALLLWLSCIAYGPYWWALLLALYGRGFLISLANNLPHYGMATDDLKYALNLSLPLGLGRLYLNFYSHRTHHHTPILPWTELERTMRAAGEDYDAPLWRRLAAQFRGPIPIAPRETA